MDKTSGTTIHSCSIHLKTGHKGFLRSQRQSDRNSVQWIYIVTRLHFPLMSWWRKMTKYSDNFILNVGTLKLKEQKLLPIRILLLATVIFQRIDDTSNSGSKDNLVTSCREKVLQFCFVLKYRQRAYFSPVSSFPSVSLNSLDYVLCSAAYHPNSYSR